MANQQDLANAIRALSMDAVQKAKSGHPGMPMGMADVATVLFKNFLKLTPYRGLVHTICVLNIFSFFRK